MPHTNGGNKFMQSKPYAAPNIAPLTPAQAALAVFRAKVGEAEFKRLFEAAEIRRLADGRPPLASVPAEVKRLSTDHDAVALSAGFGSSWAPSSLRGSRVIRVGSAKFNIPRTAEVKSSRRAGTVWVRTQDGETHILSELGELVQTATERRSTRWDLL